MQDIDADLHFLSIKASTNKLCKSSRLKLLEIASQLCCSRGDVDVSIFLKKYILLCKVVESRNVIDGNFIIKKFITDRCTIVDDSAQTSADQLYDSFAEWCRSNCVDTMSKTQFGREFGRHFRRKKSNKIFYIGVQPRDLANHLHITAG